MLSGTGGYRQVQTPKGQLFAFSADGQHVLTCAQNGGSIYQVSMFRLLLCPVCNALYLSSAVCDDALAQLEICYVRLRNKYICLILNVVVSVLVNACILDSNLLVYLLNKMCGCV